MRPAQNNTSYWHALFSSNEILSWSADKDELPVYTEQNKNHAF